MTAARSALPRIGGPAGRGGPDHRRPRCRRARHRHGHRGPPVSRRNSSRCRQAKSGWSASAAMPHSSASSTSRRQDGGSAEPLQHVGQEAVRRPGKPAGPVDRVGHARTPRTRAQAAVAGYAVSRAGCGGPGRASRTVTNRAGSRVGEPVGRATLPVDDPAHAAAGDQQVARPEVTMHQGPRRRYAASRPRRRAGRPGRRRRRAGCRTGGGSRRATPSSMSPDDRPGRWRAPLQPGQPAPAAAKSAATRGGPGRMPPGVVRREHRLPGHRGHDQHRPAEVLDGRDDLWDRRAQRSERPAGDGQLFGFTFDAARRGVGGRHLRR